MIDIKNKHDKLVVSIQADKNEDGGIVLYDRHGDLGWGMNGKQ